MPESTWRVILQEGEGGGGAAAGAQQGSVAEQKAAKAQDEIVSEQKKQQPMWANVAKFVGGLVSIVGVIAFVFQMIRRSKIFSTFMDSFLMVLSAFIDIMMIPLIPLFSWVLKLLVGLLPHVQSLSASIANFFKDPWKAVNDIFGWLVEMPERFFKGIENILSRLNISAGLTGLFGQLGSIWGDFADEVEPIFKTYTDALQQIWGDPNTSIWDKIVASAGATFEAIVAMAPAAWDAIKATAVTLWNALFGEDGILRKKWDELFASIMGPLTGNQGMGNFTGKLDEAAIGMEQFKENMDSMSNMATVIDETASNLGAFQTEYRAKATGMLELTGQEMSDVWSTYSGQMHDIWSDQSLSLWGKIQLSAQLTWDGIKTVAVVVWEYIKNQAQLTWDYISGYWTGVVLPQIENFFSNTLPEYMRQMVSDIMSAVRTAISDWWQGSPNREANPELWDYYKGEGMSDAEIEENFRSRGYRTGGVWGTGQGTGGASAGWMGDLKGIGEEIATPPNHWYEWIPFVKPIADLVQGAVKYHQHGINFVPQDELAYLHRGEQVVPAHLNNGNNGGKTITATFNMTGGNASPFWGINTQGNLERAMQDSRLRF